MELNLLLLADSYPVYEQYVRGRHYSLSFLYGHKIQPVERAAFNVLTEVANIKWQDWCACYENGVCLQIFQEALKSGQKICRYRQAAIDKLPISMKRADLRRASLMVSQQNILQNRSVLLTSFPHEFIWLQDQSHVAFAHHGVAGSRSSSFPCFQLVVQLVLTINLIEEIWVQASRRLGCKICSLFLSVDAPALHEKARILQRISLLWSRQI